MTTRRQFMFQTAAGASLLASGLRMPAFLGRSASACGRAADQPTLVIVQLTGGNDGLNTVVPYAQDAYYRARPTLAVPDTQVHRLADGVGLHPEMTGFKRLFDDGRLSVINGVGYPNPDRSHFRSMDIWHTATTTPESSDDGWLGRVTDRIATGTDTPPALHFDDVPLPLALKSADHAVPSIGDIDSFRLRDASDELESAIAARRADADDNLLFVQRVAVSACRNAERIESVVRGTTGNRSYPSYRLATRLSQIAQLIAADFGPQIYYTSLGGFDTHSQQILAHGPLLRELSESVTAFLDDIKARGLSDKVLVMTFSEFGRRVGENGSRGTDHGAGAPMFIAGDACRAGLVGATPDLGTLTDGDVAHDIDFRRVYATVLDRWLKVDHTGVLGQKYAGVDVL